MDTMLRPSDRSATALIKEVNDQAAEYALQMKLALENHPPLSANDSAQGRRTGSDAAAYRPRVAEFFAGIGLVRRALEQAGFEIVFANDIEPVKYRMYAANFDASHFVLGDIRQITGVQIPDSDLATASFPCTDLSLAGNRAGLGGQQSGMFWEFARILGEMGDRKPQAVLLENVPSFASSHGGKDLYAALERLNALGYGCDLIVVDARHFVPQSRPRLFIVGSLYDDTESGDWSPSALRPAWVRRFAHSHSDLSLTAHTLPLPPTTPAALSDVVERLGVENDRWWVGERLHRFLSSLSSRQRERLELMRDASTTIWATAYRRTRDGRPMWEIRNDGISGCLRTARGGSGKQALVEAGQGEVRVRWMLPVEYARLQGAGDFEIPPTVSESQALFGFGDAVCVPAVAWLAREYLRPFLASQAGLTGQPAVRHS